MLAKHFVFLGLIVLFAAGCTTTDKPTAHDTNSSSAQTQLSEKNNEKTKIMAQAQKPEENDLQVLAYSPAPKPPAQEYHLPHATAETEKLITLYAHAYDVPERLVRRVVRRESHGNPQARNGPYWGLMQISYPTAQGMGYQGKPEGLLDAETNLKYAVKYLAGAYLVAGGDETRAVQLYARGFYYDAKAKGLLERTGLRPGPSSIMTAFADE